MSETLLNGTPENTSGVNQNVTVTGTDKVGGAGGNPAPYDFKTMLGEAGEFSENWRDGLPEGIRGEPCLDNIKNIAALANSYVHAQKAFGANKVALPNENSSDEDWAAFYKACGRPEAETDYKTDGLTLPDGVTLDPAAVDSFRKFAFQHGFNQKTFNAALAFDVERVKAAAAAKAAAEQAEYNESLTRLNADESSGELRQKFGNDFATVNAVIAQCNKAMNVFGLTEIAAKAGLLNNYDFIRAMAAIGSSMSESRLKGVETATPATPDPRIRLNEIMHNPDDPYYKSEHPAHDSRVAEVKGLLAAISNANKAKKA